MLRSNFYRYYVYIGSGNLEKFEGDKLGKEIKIIDI